MSPVHDRILTVSNGLSVVRVALVIPIVLLLRTSADESRLPLLGLMMLAVLTDFLDGWFARQFSQVTELGKIIDPLADKLSVGIVALVLVLTARIPQWYFFLVIGRDLAILAGGIYIRHRTNITLQSNTLGKWAVTAVALYILFVVMVWDQASWAGEILLILTAGMLILSFVVYARRFIAVVSGSAAPSSAATPTPETH